MTRFRWDLALALLAGWHLPMLGDMPFTFAHSFYGCLVALAWGAAAYQLVGPAPWSKDR